MWFSGYIGYSAGNFSPENTILNDIDIRWVLVQNTIEWNYHDMHSSREKTIKLSKSASDILAEHMNLMNKKQDIEKSIIQATSEDSDEDTLLKFFETLWNMNS